MTYCNKAVSSKGVTKLPECFVIVICSFCVFAKFTDFKILFRLNPKYCQNKIWPEN